MSLHVLKRKTNTYYSKNHSNNEGFSLNNSRRLHCPFEQIQTPFKGNVAKGNGGCCGTYSNDVIYTQYVNSDPFNQVRPSVKSYSSYLNSKIKDVYNNEKILAKKILKILKTIELNANTLGSQNINDIDFNEGVIYNINDYETDFLDLSQNIYSNPTLVTLNASDKINENNIPINYVQNFKLASGMTTNLGYWGKNAILNHNNNSFVINKYRSDIDCFEVYSENSQTRFRLTNNAYAGKWRVDFRMILGNQLKVGVHNFFLTLQCNQLPTQTTAQKHIYRAYKLSQPDKLPSNAFFLTSYDTFDVASQDNYFEFSTFLVAVSSPASNSNYTITDFDLTFTYQGI